MPLEDDLLSLELGDVARDIFLVSLTYTAVMRQVANLAQNGDDTPIYNSSLALMTLQRAFGLFPRLLGKGDGAKVGYHRLARRMVS